MYSFILPSTMKGKNEGRSIMSKSLQSHRLQPTRLLCPWGFSRQENWSRLPCPPPGDLSNPGIKPKSPSCRQILNHLSLQGSPLSCSKSTLHQSPSWALRKEKTTGRGRPLLYRGYTLVCEDRHKQVHMANRKKFKGTNSSDGEDLGVRDISGEVKAEEQSCQDLKDCVAFQSPASLCNFLSKSWLLQCEMRGGGLGGVAAPRYSEGLKDEGLNSSEPACSGTAGLGRRKERPEEQQVGAR